MGYIRITQEQGRLTVDIEGTIGAPKEQGPIAEEDNGNGLMGTVEALAVIRETEAEEIVVNIRSLGGNVHDALLLHDALCATGARITTRCYGYVASAATVIAQAAGKGQREISANALYLIHCSESFCEGNAQTIVLTKELLEQTDRRIAELYARRSGRGAERFRTLMGENGGRGRWLSPKETVEEGLADRITAQAEVWGCSTAELERMGLPPMPRLPRHKWPALLRRVWRELTAQGAGPNGATGTEQPCRGSGQEAEGEDVPQAEKSKVAGKAAGAVRNTATHMLNDNRNARPTRTRPREDPSACEAPAPSPNEAAYRSDLENMKRDREGL